jgi:hypothetical protein
VRFRLSVSELRCRLCIEIFKEYSITRMVSRPGHLLDASDSYIPYHKKIGHLQDLNHPRDLVAALLK